MSAVRTRQLGAVLEVTLDRPPANAIDLATSRTMGAVFAAFRDDAGPAGRMAGAGSAHQCGWGDATELAGTG